MNRRHPRTKSRFFITLATLVAGSLGLWASFFVLPYAVGSVYYANRPLAQVPVDETTPPKPPPPRHLPPPTPLRAIYMSSWVAGTTDFRGQLIGLIEETELNAVVIDVKDYTGRVAFPTDNRLLQAVGSPEKRVSDIRGLIDLLHQKNIYVIARIAVFQDPWLTAKRPDLAVKRASDGAVWQDHKGAKWLDPASSEVWDYTVAIAREAEAVGFDELNFDYIRFPSDGNMRDIAYPFFDRIGLTKADSLKKFFGYLREQLSPLDVPLSADFFGMTTTNTDDLNIGQLLEDGLTYFDYIAPMVYPSHYPPGFLQYKNPAAYPYEVVKYALDESVRRAVALGQPKTKIRPWLQDFDLGAVYTAEMVKKQQQATYDAGLDSWMLWSPANRYTRGALENQP